VVTILCCGDALIDMVPDVTAAGDLCLRPLVGGAVFNTAIALGRLGAPAGFFAPLSTDAFGDSLCAALAESGVRTDLAPRTDRFTAMAFVTLTNGQARYRFVDTGSAGVMLTPSELPMLPPEVTTLHFGATSLVQEPCGSAFEALARREAGKRLISFDPNIRPALLTDPAAYRARLARLIAITDILKLSDEDLDWIGGEGSIGQWLAAGVKLVVVTRGSAGAEAWAACGHLAIPAVPVTVADTIGAGDTFAAGILAALAARGRLSAEGLVGLEKSDLDAALTLAARAAAVTVSRTGANPPWAAELL
jgi:fructokinase